MFINFKRKQSPKISQSFMEIGDTVEVVATGETGVLMAIKLSPYYAEERAGIVRGYVVMEGCADYFQASELRLVAKAAEFTAAFAS